MHIAYEVDDFDEAEKIIRSATSGSEFSDAFEIHHWVVESADEDDDTPYKSVEVYYDISAMPGEYQENPLDFRNEAMDLVEEALELAGAGEWVGAEIGMGEVNFGFEVADFDVAEKIIRETVAGTPFENIRQISRFDSEAES